MSAENKNPELQQYQRADEIINLGTLAYEAKKQQKAMLQAQVRQDAAQKFANDTPKIIKEVGDQYKNYLSRMENTLMILRQLAIAEYQCIANLLYLQTVP
jgi:CRISPR/Cas system CMR subunit Cmr6 (Cas7 group RAMP superfamily)